MTDQELRIGIIGSGFMGRTYAETTARYNHKTRLVAVAGGTRAEGLAADYGVAFEPTVEGLIDRADVDAIILTPPEAVHLAYTQMAAAAGKHVLTEKPMAPDVAQCDAMIQACGDAGVTLMVVEPTLSRHSPARQSAARGGAHWRRVAGARLVIHADRMVDSCCEGPAVVR